MFYGKGRPWILRGEFQLYLRKYLKLYRVSLRAVEEDGKTREKRSAMSERLISKFSNIVAITINTTWPLLSDEVPF